MSELIDVAPAVSSDLVYIDDLKRKNEEELAFYPKAAFEREIEKHRILLARYNNEPCGYLYHGAFDTTCKIHQACIQYDLRGYLYGAELVNFFVGLCRAAHVSSVTLRCGSDIAANGFWQAMGFYCEAITPGGVRRMRDINCWRYDLNYGLFAPTVVTPSEKQQDASIWRKREVTLGSQFLRGRALKDYRETILSEQNKKRDR